MCKQRAVRVCILAWVMTLVLWGIFTTAAAEPSEYFFGYECTNSTPANPYLYRFGINGDIVWERSLPYTEFLPAWIMADRNLMEDAYYLMLGGESNRIDGKLRLQKYDSAGDLEWDLPLVEEDHPYPAVSANPVLGGAYVSTPNQGVWRLDGAGNVLWGPTTFGFSTTGEIYWEACADATTGGGFAVRHETSGSGQVIRFDANGVLLWTTDMWYPGAPQANPLDGGVYVHSYSDLYRLGPGGEIKWSKSCFPSCYLYSRAVSPLDGSLCIGSGWPSMIARIAMDGGVAWNVDVYEYASHFSMAFDVREDALYVSWGETENRGFSRYRGSDFSQVWHVPPPHGGAWCILDMGMPAAADLTATVAFDIKPGSCPNPLSTTPFANNRGNSNPNKGGVLPVAILGTATLDVYRIDASTVRLEGAEPLRYDYEDVGTPAAGDDECPCTSAGPDGRVDLTLKFQKSQIVAALGAVSKGNVLELTITGLLEDGTPFEGSDCVTIVGEGQGDKELRVGGVVLKAAVPNPFNPTTMISFTLPERAKVALSIYDVGGKLVRTLVDEVLGEGYHEHIWDGKDYRGEPVASGVYFYRLTTGTQTLTRKAIILK